MATTVASPDKEVLQEAALRGVERYLKTQATTAGRRVLSLPAVLARIPLSRVTIWRMERAGQFPKRIQISPNRVAWLESDIDAWLEERRGDHGSN